LANPELALNSLLDKVRETLAAREKARVDRNIL